MRFKKVLGTLSAVALSAGLLAVYPVQHVQAATPTASGTEANPAHATIDKHLSMPEGTTTPVGTATFKFTSVSVDGAAATPTNMPTIPDRSVTFATSDTGTVTGGVKTVHKESANIVDSVTFPHAGEYIYTVKEDNAGFTLTNDTFHSEIMEYSTKVYQVQVIVANNAAGTGTYVQSISVNDYTGGTLGAKMNDNDDGEGTSFEFDNKFMRTTKNDPNDPDNDTQGKNLRIKKVVAGAGGNYQQYFDFSVTVTAPAGLPASAPTSYKAVISDNGAAVDPTSNGITGAGADHTFTITPGTALNFKLKHNQQLVLLDAPVGAKYVASETAASSYTAKYVQTVNGVAGSETTGNSVTSTALGEGLNSWKVTNTKADITPTGIVLSNLPYIMIGVIAVAGFAFLMNRKHNRTEA